MCLVSLRAGMCLPDKLSNVTLSMSPTQKGERPHETGVRRTTLTTRNTDTSGNSFLHSFKSDTQARTARARTVSHESPHMLSRFKLLVSSRPFSPVFLAFLLIRLRLPVTVCRRVLGLCLSLWVHATCIGSVRFRRFFPACWPRCWTQACRTRVFC